MSSTRPQRRATKRLYANGGASVEQDVEMSEGERVTRSKRVNKARSKKSTKSPKREGKQRAPSSDDEEQDELDSSSEAEQPAKKRKKATNIKKNQRKDKQKQGKLEFVAALPVELLTEICSYLSPGDLLSLSVTSKAFRSLLVPPNASVSLWKAARCSVGLPDWTAGDLTEQQYAQMLYGRHCQVCNRSNVQHVDLRIRKRLCKTCRTNYWIKLNAASLSESHPHLHPLSLQACLVTNHPLSATYDWYWGEHSQGIAYAFLPDLELVSDKLYALDDRAALYDSDDDDNENTYDHTATCKRFVKARDELRSKCLEDAKTIAPILRDLKEARRDDIRRANQVQRRSGATRRADIERKVLDLNEGYTRNDFVGAWYTSKFTMAPEPLLDEDWDELKPKIIKLLARIKKAESKSTNEQEQLGRQQRLRPRYDKLLRFLPSDEVRNAVHLFADFLHLDSIKPFWEPEDADPENDEAFNDARDEILEELDDYRLSIRLEAVRTILGATTEMTEEDLTADSDEFGPEQYDDEFLERPTSFLMCTLPNCYRERSWSFDEGTYTSTPQCLVFFGSLADLLEHQHDFHSNVTFTTKERAQATKDGTVGHFALPSAVVSALSAIIEVGELEDESVTVEELDGVVIPWTVNTRDTYTRLYWENPPSGRRHFDDWRELIEVVYHQCRAATKAKRLIEVPTISIRGPNIETEKKKTKSKRAKKGRKTGSRPWDWSDGE